jgi:hypothetical protein
LGCVLLTRRGSRAWVIGGVVVLAASAAVYLAAHQMLYGGLTVYAAGGHFVEGGQLSVMGYEANYPGRAVRLLGLLVDRRFGVAAWTPVYLLAVPALAALVRARPRGWPVLVAPLAAAWLNATFVAQTMHGWWSPGRQIVVALPALVLAVAWWVGRVRAALGLVVALGTIGLVNWAWAVFEASTGRRTLVVDFFETANPLYRTTASVLPDGMRAAPVDAVWTAVWLVVVAGLAVVGWRSVAPTLDVPVRKEHPSCSPSPATSLV